MIRDGKTRVLWLIKGLGLGGAEMLLEMAAPHLDRDRFDYQVGYFLPWKDALVERLERQDLPVTCFHVTSSFSLPGVNRLKRFCGEQQIDVLHIHLPMPGVMGRLAGKMAGVPAIVYTEHNLWSRLNLISRTLNRVTYPLNDQAIAVSEDVANSIPSSKAGRVEVINNGIDCDAVIQQAGQREKTRADLGISDDCIVIGKVANLTPKKNHELLIDAFQRLHQQIPNSRLLLVGQFADRDAVLRGRARDRGIEEAVIFHGPSTDVPELVAAMDVFAMSSKFEGLPIALLEAMALAKPVVCTSVGGIPQVVRNGQDGYLVDAGNADALAQRLIQLASDRKVCEQMGQAAQDRVRDAFDIRAMVRSVEQIYIDVLQRKGREHS